MARSAAPVRSFDLQHGRVLGGKYRVEGKLGGGWEGEVYRVVEIRTGIERAAKLFYPQRNVNDRAVTFYAKKLEKLRHCPVVIRYQHSETIQHRRAPITCLISEYVEGELLSNLIARQPGRRLMPFEALHMVYTLAGGLEQIHRAREYHGDLHDGNVLVSRQGLFFSFKLVDFFHLGRPTAAHMRQDVADLIRILYDAVGGAARYAAQPTEIKDVCRGLRRDLISRRFPTVRHLREHLESFEWDR